ncbi:MAG: hypothetical protein KFH98_00920 [Gemmatimonadetes bacterium]|nr:hypothetical protein [Gemmatimonadota bacterium]
MMTLTTMRRLSLLLAISFFTAGCELIGDIFQAGFVVGIIIVLLIVGIVGWILSRFRGRGGV